MRLNRFLKGLILTASLVICAGIARATDIAYTGTFVGTEGLATTGTNGVAISKTYTRDINTTGPLVSLQVTFSTYTVAVSTTFSSRNYTVNTPTITISGFSTGWMTGLQVLYSTGTAAISGLTNQTTYYLSVISGGGTGGSGTTNPVVFKLASSLANAVAGTGIVLASSSTTANIYTLAPLSFTNTSGGGILFQSSDDNSNFANISISSVTFASTAASSMYDLGQYNHRYLRVKETPPTTGAIVYTVTSNERYSFKH